MHIFEGTPNQLDSCPVMKLNRSTFQELTFRTGVILALGVGFALPISTSLTSAFTIGVLICWILSGQYRVTFQLFKTYRVATVSVILFGILAAGLLSTPETISLATRNLLKYRQFLMIPVYLSFFLDQKFRLRGIRMFELALIFTLAVSMFCWFFGIEWDIKSQDHAIFKNRITQNILMSFLVYLSAWRFMENYRKNWPYAILALIAAVNILAIVPGRSGYLALGVLIVLLMYQKLGYKGLVPAAVSVIFVGLVTYHSSTRFQERIDLAFNELRNYQQAQYQTTSVGLRLQFLENGLELAQANPILGSGTGSFPVRYRQLMGEKGQKITANPHNEYVLLLVQNGVLGAGVFLLFFWVSWRSIQNSSEMDQAMGQAVIAVYLVGCLVNSLMMDTTEGGLFGYLIGLTCAGGITATRSHLAAPVSEDTSTVDEDEAVRIRKAA